MQTYPVPASSTPYEQASIRWPLREAERHERRRRRTAAQAETTRIIRRASATIGIRKAVQL